MSTSSFTRRAGLAALAGAGLLLAQAPGPEPSPSPDLFAPLPGPLPSPELFEPRPLTPLPGEVGAPARPGTGLVPGPLGGAPRSGTATLPAPPVQPRGVSPDVRRPIEGPATSGPSLPSSVPSPRRDLSR